MTLPTPTLAGATATWNSRYAGTDYLFGTEPNAWLCEHAAQLPPRARVLCVADGEGRNSVWLAQQGHQVEAFDVSARAVAKARVLAQRANVEVAFQVTDCDAYPWAPARFDAVVAIFVQFADPALRARLFAHMAAALRPGGVLVLQGYTPRQLAYGTGGPPWVEHLYTRELLDAAFPGLQTLVLREYEAELHEGTGHHGRSALIGLVARASR